jgi:hypothetical protein
LSIASDANDTASLPMFPPVRSAACPFDPPADFAGWCNEEGPRRCRWRGVEVLRRLPNLQAAVPLEELRFRSDMGIFGVHEFPVLW